MTKRHKETKRQRQKDKKKERIKCLPKECAIPDWITKQIKSKKRPMKIRQTKKKDPKRVENKITR